MSRPAINNKNKGTQKLTAMIAGRPGTRAIVNPTLANVLCSTTQQAAVDRAL